MEERRAEPRSIINRFYSVELSPPGLGMSYQFKIWNISKNGVCIIIGRDSEILKFLKVGESYAMKYYPTDSKYGINEFDTQLVHITEASDNRFKNHFMVGLRLIDKSEA